MLYNLLFLSISILGVLAGMKLGMSAYRQGLKDNQRVENGLEIVDPKPKKKIKMSKKQEKEIERFNTLLDNIERYDGTSDGQEDLNG